MMLRIRRAMTGQSDSNVTCHMVYVEDIRRWLRGKRVIMSRRAISIKAKNRNFFIDDLLQEIEDAEKEGVS